MLNKIGSIILFYLTISSVVAQTNLLKFQRIGIDQGLSQSAVTSIIQDRDGFIWIATRDGLNKYDGYKFVTFRNNSNSSNSISNNNIRKITEDRNGNLWFATWGGGLNCFDKEKERFIHYKNNPDDPTSISNNFLHTVIEDHEGKLWIGTDAGGVNMFDPTSKTFKRFLHDSKDSSSLSHNETRVILEDLDRNIWVGTRKGLNRYNRKTNTFTRFYANPQDPYALSDNFIRAVMEDSKGDIWFGTYQGGLVRYAKRENKFYREIESFGKGSISTKAVLSFVETEDGKLWVGTENGGLTLYDPVSKKVENYLHDKIDPYSLSNNSIYCISKDIKGNLWIGTFNDGINFLNRDFKFKHYRQTSSSNGLSNNIVLSIFQDSKERIWVSTDGGGLNKFDPKTGLFTQYLHEPGNPNTIGGNHVLSIGEDSDSNIWLGLWAAGVTVLNPEKNTFQHFKNNPQDPNSLNHNNIWKVFKDSRNNMWLGTYGSGLDLYDKETNTFRHFTYSPDNPDGLGYNNLYNIYEDSKGILWICTDGGGISLLDPDKLTFKTLKMETGKNSISNNSVNSVFEDSKGRIWIGTSEGLNQYDRKTGKFQVFDVKDGLPNEVIMGVIEDKLGSLWLSTNNGLAKFNPDTKKVQNFTLADGLESVEFRRHAFLKAKNGLMYFGGKNGFNEFDPLKLTSLQYEPPLILTDFLIFNQPVEIKNDDASNSILEKHISKTNKLTIPYDQSVISFEFATLNYTFPEKKKYAYRLEGFDKDWNYVGASRTATYTNLNPGKYVFRVKGLNNTGEWSKKEIALKLTIDPPFWMTAWFRTLVVVLFLTVILSLIMVRENIIKRQKMKLEVQVKERTLEVTEQKEEILAQRKELEKMYKDTMDSIYAAQEIQQSIFPSEQFIKAYLPDSFILNKPKDLVSGDFYWFDQINGKIVIAVADCTGHGVSGAFMSLLGHNLMNQSIYSHDDLVASEILDRLNEGIVKEVKPRDQDAKILDGMDVALCIIDVEKGELQFAGAKSPLYIIRNNELIEVKCDRYSIGLSIGNKINKFQNNVLKIESGDTFYIFSDGYADQIGGQDGMEKFKYQRFRELIKGIASLTMESQMVMLDEKFLDWRKDTPQLDDVLVMGFKVPPGKYPSSHLAA